MFNEMQVKLNKICILERESLLGLEANPKYQTVAPILSGVTAIILF